MAQYEGTIIVVSHNRYFVNSFVNKVLEIKNGRAVVYEGNIDDYLDCRRKEKDELGNIQKSRGSDLQSVAVTAQAEGTDKKALRRERAQARQKLHQQLKPLKDIVEAAEKEIEELEVRKHELEQMMADPELYKDQDRWAEVSREYNTVERRIERNYAKWEDAQGKIEEMEAVVAESN